LLAETRRPCGVMDRRLARPEFFAGGRSIADFPIPGRAWRHDRPRVDLGTSRRCSAGVARWRCGRGSTWVLRCLCGPWG